MKKLVLAVAVLFAMGIAATVVISDTSVTTGEKDDYIELSARLKKVNNLLSAKFDDYNAAVEVKNQEYQAALLDVKDIYQPQIDAYKAEIIAIELQLEGIK